MEDIQEAIFLLGDAPPEMVGPPIRKRWSLCLFESLTPAKVVAHLEASAWRKDMELGVDDAEQIVRTKPVLPR